jgi:hypothetical protein
MLVQRQFNLSQTHGTAVAADRFSFYENRGISLNLVDQENLVDQYQEIVSGLVKEIKDKEAGMADMLEAGMSDYATLPLQREIAYMEKRVVWFQKQIDEIQRFLDKQHEQERRDVELFHIPYHWMCAKEYWEHILDWTSHNKNRMNRSHWLRLYKKVNDAKAKKSISSWFYFTISYECALALNMQQEKNRLLNYALACKKACEEDGRTWAPQKKEDEVLFDAEGDSLTDWASGLTESALIEAIDRRSVR